MSDKLHEQLSALVDDELPRAEQSLLLERLSRDADLRLRLGRYQLVKDVLANRIAMQPDMLFSDRVMQALEAEQRYQQGPVVPLRRWAKPIAGVAVAASVALVAVVSVQSLSTQETQPQPLAGATMANPPTALVATQPAPSSTALERVAVGQWNRQAPQVRDRLNGYLVQHNEYAASSGVQGMIPYVRIVGYDNGSND